MLNGRWDQKRELVLTSMGTVVKGIMKLVLIVLRYRRGSVVRL